MQNDDFFEDLKQALLKRKSARIPDNLISRIIAAAEKSEQKKPLPFRIIMEIFTDITAMLLIPKPSYVLGGFLIMGLLVGAFIDASGIFISPVPEELVTFMTIEDQFVAGEWL